MSLLLLLSSSKKDIATALPVFTVAPAISGICTAGQTLSCTTGTATGGGITYAYQWQIGGVDISGATASTYVVDDEDDLGEDITCEVTATNTIGSDTATSNALEIVFDYSILALPTGQSLARNQTGDNTSYFGSDGLLHWAASDAPRFDHRYTGSAWVFDGLLVEPERMNYLTYSAFDLNQPPTGWTVAADSTAITNVASVFGGRAESFNKPTTGGAYITQNVTLTSEQYTFSTLVEAVSGTPVGGLATLSLTISSGAGRYTIKPTDVMKRASFSHVLGVDVSGAIRYGPTTTRDELGVFTLSYPQWERIPSGESADSTSIIKTEGDAVIRVADELTVPLPAAVTSLTIVHGDDTTTTVAKSALTDAGGGLYTITAVNAALAKYSVKQIRKAA